MGTYPIRGPVALPTASLELRGVWLPLSVMTLEIMFSYLDKDCWENVEFEQGLLCECLCPSGEGGTQST